LKTIPALIEQTLETNGAPETESRQRTVRPAALPEATSGVANRI
jgi:hypothetical protein